MKTDVTRRTSLVVTTGLVLALWLAGPSAAPAGEITEEIKSSRADLQYQNYLGYEGIATLGFWGFDYGPTPTVGDWVTTHCRYIDVPNAPEGEYFLRYPIHIPHGSVITGVSLFLADFSAAGHLAAMLWERRWNSRDFGTQLRYTDTDNEPNNDILITMENLNVSVNNQSHVYWIDVTPDDSASPGELCVYGIQVAYDCTGCLIFGDSFESGDYSAWSSVMP